MRKEKGDFFIFFVERQKVALATQVSTHRLFPSVISTSPHHRRTDEYEVRIITNYSASNQSPLALISSIRRSTAWSSGIFFSMQV